MSKPMAHPMLEALCRERYGRLVALATMLSGDRDVAEDLVQEALISTFSRSRKFETLAGADAYVRAAIASRFLDRARKSSKEKVSVRRLAARESLVVAAPGEPEPVLDAVLAQLPPRVRACVALRFLDDLSVRQTASVLGLSEGAVKRYVSDGLAALNAALGANERLQRGPEARVDIRRSDRG